MSIDQEVEILRKIPLFANIDPAKLKLMAFASPRVTYRQGESLFYQGDAGDSAYIIVEGSADIILETDKGPLTVATVKGDDIVGEIAILCDVPRTATVTAREELVTLQITKELFFQMVTDFPEMAIEIMRVLAHRLENTTNRLLEARGQN